MHYLLPTLLLVLLPLTVHAQSTPAAMMTTTEAFIATLSEAERAVAMWEFDAEERQNWNFVPIPGQRKGLAIKAMTTDQRKAAHAMLMTALSNQGYLKATGIIRLEDILAILENRPAYRDPELYYLTLFGRPSTETPWGWRFEGHHLSLNFSSVDQTLVAAPLFWGANPGQVREGPHAGLRVLGEEEDAGRTLLHALSAEQQSQAIINDTAPREIITGNARKVRLEQIEGLPAASMTEAQQKLLWDIIYVYALNLPADVAEVQLAGIKAAGTENLHFAWAGGVRKGEKHYYRIHGPTFLIEYDNTQGNGNHIHTVWRDLKNDFGEDLLREHYERHEH